MAVTCNVSEALYEPCSQILHQMLQDLAPDQIKRRHGRRKEKKNRDDNESLHMLRNLCVMFKLRQFVKGGGGGGGGPWKRYHCNRRFFLFLPLRRNLSLGGYPKNVASVFSISGNLLHNCSEVLVTRECRTLQNNTSYHEDYYLVSKTIMVSKERIKGAKLSPSKAHLG